jgi:phosphatidyl-myo-inositol alpha-mannosyltransferase
VKILHIDPDDLDNPVSGGGPVRTFEIYRRLAKKHDITVLTPSFENCTRELVKEGVRYIRVGNKFRDHNSSYFITFFFQVPFFARKFDYDILVEDLMPPTAATITPLLNKKPIVASVQWFFAKEWADHYKLPFHLYQPMGLKLYKNFICLTEDMKEKISKYNKTAKYEVIPEGIDAAFFDTEPVSEDFILFLGRIENYQKGVDLLVEAYHKASQYTDLKLVIAGDGIDYEKTKAQVEELGLSNRVTFVGKVDMEQKKDLLSRCQFVCMPSRYETFGMVSIESFASAKPVILFDIPCLRTVVNEDVARIIKPFDVEEYTKAIIEFSNDKDKCRDMGIVAREYARNFCWDKIAKAQEVFYESCI